MFSWQMYSVHGTHISGSMMMAVMRRKVRIISGEISGKRCASGKQYSITLKAFFKPLGSFTLQFEFALS